jgi:hypothetical protein
MPDYNAYTLSQNTPEMDASQHPFRYAGGHIHLGWSSPYLKKASAEYQMVKNEENHPGIIKMLDLLVSIPTLPLDNAPGSKHRRDKYGKAGCFRPTPYGVEYRTQSCWWLQSPITASLVFGLGRLAWSILAQGKGAEFLKYVDVSEEEVRGTIDEGDVRNAKKIWKKMRPYVACSGEGYRNPIHVRSAMASTYSARERFRANWSHRLESVDIPGLVTGLGVFEYMLKHGVLSVIGSNNPAECWSIPSEEPEENTNPVLKLVGPVYNGFVSGGYDMLYNNKDFQSFQISLWKECVAA